MSLFANDYNSGGSASSNDGDYDNEERESLKLSTYGVVSFKIDRIEQYTGQQYGQSVIVDVDDVQVLDGLAYDRFYQDDDDTIKVFGYDKWFRTDENGQLDEDVDENLVNQRITEEFGGNDYPYDLMGRTTQEDEPIELGNMTMWLSNSTKNRTFLKVVTEAGHNVVDDKEDDHNWAVEENLDLRNDLEDRRIILFYKNASFVPDGQDEVVEFVDAVVLDEDTRAGITIQNGSSDSSSSSSSGDDDGESGSLGSSSGDLPEGVPDELNDIIGFMARTDQTDAEGVQQLVESELDDGEAEDVDLDAVISEIEERK